MNKNVKKKKKGFTLIELIVVIAILGILSAVAVPRLSGFQESAKTSADQATFATIDRAIAIGAANDVFKATTNASGVTTAGTIVATVDTDGGITFSGTANGAVSTEMAKLVESNPKFKKSTHFGTTYTWSIAGDGTITKPSGF